MEWFDVAKIHRTIQGVYVKDGRVHSLLFGNERYVDRVTQKGLKYRVTKRYKHAVEALKGALKDGYTFPVFRKKAKNDWTAAGEYSVAEVREVDDEQFEITLLPVNEG